MEEHHHAVADTTGIQLLTAVRQAQVPAEPLLAGVDIIGIALPARVNLPLVVIHTPAV